MWQARERTAYGIMFLRHEGKRTHVVTNRRSYGVKIYLKIRWEGVVCIRQAQDSDMWGGGRCKYGSAFMFHELQGIS